MPASSASSASSATSACAVALPSCPMDRSAPDVRAYAVYMPAVCMPCEFRAHAVHVRHLLRVALERQSVVGVREFRAETRAGRVRALQHHPPVRGVGEPAHWLVIAAQPLEQRRAAATPRAARSEDEAACLHWCIGALAH
eukprot:scaffold50598_cov75-Phaeocystis_antarctica.AAC.2